MLKVISTGLLGLLATGWAQTSTSNIDLPDSIMAPGTATKWIKKIQAYCEGPAVDPQGNFYFTQQKGNDWPIWKINPADPSDTGKIWVASGKTNGLAFDAQGRLYGCQKGKIARYSAAGQLDSIIATSGKGATFDQANDLSLVGDGSLYFTDLASNVFYVDPKGVLSVAATGFKGANGVEYIAEEKAVYVLENQGAGITRLDVSANGSLTNPKAFANYSQSDGADLDSHGNWYAGSYGEGTVYVFNAKGEKLGTIAFKLANGGAYDANPGDRGNICNCHFGGVGRKTLYCVGDGGAYSLDLKIPGRTPLFATGVAPHRLQALFEKAKTGERGVRPDGREIPSRSMPVFAVPAATAR